LDYSFLDGFETEVNLTKVIESQVSTYRGRDPRSIEPVAIDRDMVERKMVRIPGH